MDRVTKTMLHNMLENLNRKLEKLGHQKYYLTIYAPGDGWTRYKLVTIDNDGGQWEPFGARNYTNQEMYAALRHLSDMLYQLHP